ncbi:MAG: potassium-transporting ATPase subunit F [Mycobacterium sp.]|nr:potassium-transporting ATPase subunit F [Mycobacterium sp.]
MTGAERRQDGRAGLRLADGCGIRRTGPDTEAGRTTVSYENIVGLALSVLLALYLGVALLLPEKF